MNKLIICILAVLLLSCASCDYNNKKQKRLEIIVTETYDLNIDIISSDTILNNLFIRKGLESMRYHAFNSDSIILYKYMIKGGELHSIRQGVIQKEFISVLNYFLFSDELYDYNTVVNSLSNAGDICIKYFRSDTILNIIIPLAADKIVIKQDANHLQLDVKSNAEFMNLIKLLQQYD